MSRDLCVEFQNTQTTANPKVEDLQATMSQDLRNEFATTHADFNRLLIALSNMIEKTIALKFEGADKRFDDVLKVQRDRMETTVKEIESAIQLMEGNAGGKAQDAVKHLTEMYNDYIKIVRPDYFNRAKD